ncbi:MAG: hypothetical protein R2911_06325 [Caldilineaceae bacterium]
MMISNAIDAPLAVDGGTPVIQRELNRYKGAAVIGDEEKAAVLEVLESQSLFRYYGPHLLSKVAQLSRILRPTWAPNMRWRPAAARRRCGWGWLRWAWGRAAR